VQTQSTGKTRRDERLTMPAGRPSKYNPAMCETAIESGKIGKTLVGMADDLDIDRGTLNEWMKIHPEFSLAVKEGLRRSQAWWEEQGRVATFGGIDGFNATSYIFQMKNRFRAEWNDTIKSDHTSSDGSMTPQVVERIIVQAKDADG
jgi:transposase